MATGAVQAYDTSSGVSDAAIQQNYSALNTSSGVVGSTGPMGTADVTTYMPGTGGRQDIAPQPNWTAQWLLSQNATAQQVMMANGDASGSIPWHYIDQDTGEPISSQTYPNFVINEDYPGSVQPANGWPTYNTNIDPWTPDPAHMPDLNYVPYHRNRTRYFHASYASSAISPRTLESRGRW
jgi:hypothetical protein